MPRGGSLNNVIEKVLYEDIAVVYNLKQNTLPVLKKLIWLVATSVSLIPNMDKISKNLKISREAVYNGLEYLDQAGLLNNLRSDSKGMKLIRKPGKIFLENPNLLYAINGGLRLEGDVGSIRETFFVNQVIQHYKLNLHDYGDFIVEGKYIVEVGGRSKDFRQIKSLKDAFLAVDDIEVGFGRKIPLYLFGFLF